MKNTKGSKKVVNGLVCIVMLVLIGFIVYQHHQINVLSQALNAANKSMETMMSGQNNITQKSSNQGTTLASKGKGQNDIDDLRYQLEAAEEELDMAHKQLSDELAKKNETANNMIQGPEDMLQTPEGKKRLRNALKNGFDQTYSALFKQLNLSDEKLDQLKELLTDQSMATMEFNNDVQGSSPTEENRKKLQQRLEDQKKQNDAALAALLGSPDYQTLKDYDDRSRERTMIQMFSQTLSYDDTLTGEQKKTLIESMYRSRKDAYSQQGWDEERVSFPSDINDEGVAEIMEMNDRVYNGYIKSAEATLSASQAVQFKEYLEKEQAMIKSSLNQQARMAGGQSTGDNTESDGGEEAQSVETIVIMR